MSQTRHYYDLEDAVPEIVALAQPVSPKLIRIEGAMRAGKSPLARLLASALGARHINGDCYAEPSERGSYADRIKKDEFQAELRTALASGDWVIVEAVCLEEIAPTPEFGSGLHLYVLRRSALGIWEDFDEGGHIPSDELHRSIHLYHLHERPHEKADFVLELPRSAKGLSSDRPPCS